MLEETSVKVETSGEGVKPPEEKIVAVETLPGPVCPESDLPCTESPPCDLKAYTGRVYCLRWVARVRSEGAAEALKK